MEATLFKIDDVLYKNDPHDIIAHRYLLKTDRVFRGMPQQIVSVYESNDSGRASFDWKVGRMYVLFLVDSVAPSDEHVLSLDGCGNSAPTSRATSTLREIDEIDRRKGALIAGMVSVYNLSAPLPDIQVQARSGDKIYKASTDKKGRFTIEVAPGDYTVEPVQSPFSFQMSDLSYEDPRHLKMQPRSCAQVQFIETSQR